MSAENLEEIKKKIEQAAREKQDNARLLSVNDILEKSVITIHLPEYGGYIKARKLSITEIEEIRRKTQSQDEIPYLIIWKSLNSVDPTVTLEDVKALPHDAFIEITKALTPHPYQASNAGSQ